MGIFNPSDGSIDLSLATVTCSSPAADQLKIVVSDKQGYPIRAQFCFLVFAGTSDVPVVNDATGIATLAGGSGGKGTAALINAAAAAVVEAAIVTTNADGEAIVTADQSACPQSIVMVGNELRVVTLTA